jgi:amidase
MEGRDDRWRPDVHPAAVDRRTFLRWAAAATSAAALAPHLAGRALAATPTVVEATIAQLQAAMTAGQLTAQALVGQYVQRIQQLDRHGPAVNSVLELNPDAAAIAAQLDAERGRGVVRGPLHGIPVLLKDNIDTGDRMQTAAGSLALVGQAPAQDSTVAARLRQAGAVILGKTNLSEWANFRSTHSISGWSARGGQCHNPYVLTRSPSGSSSGSAAATSASFCAAALGTETNGSIVSPASANGVVGIKPTVGLTSRAGVVPISHTQDTVGIHGRTVADAAAVLGPLTGPDPRDAATQNPDARAFPDYTRFLDAGALRGARIGVARTNGFGVSSAVDAIITRAIAAMRNAGAVIVDPANIPTQGQLGGGTETTLLLFEFKHDLDAYLSTRAGVPIRTLADAIAFNQAHAAQELALFGQELFVQAQAKNDLSDPAYRSALSRSLSLSRAQGIDRVMGDLRLDALVAPTAFSSTPSAQAGYPIVTVPAGFSSRLPVDISFIGQAFTEPRLIALAFAFERLTMARRPPAFLPR